MGIRNTRIIWGWFALITIALSQVAAAAADFIMLNTGVIIRGEIVNVTSEKISIRTTVGGFTSVVSYSRDVIDHYVIDEKPEEERGQQPQRDSEPSEPDELTKPEEGTPLVVIPLHGQVGGLHKGRVDGTFDADMLHECFREAERLGAPLVVLDINSPGGYVDEMEAICETIQSWSGRLRIVAFAHEAYSAAAVIALSCRELAVKYDARIGAAVMMQGNSAVDAKRASPHLAKQRQFMAVSRKPYELLQAMTIQETELWWSLGRGFRTEKPPADETDWQLVDDRTTVLTMTGAQADKWGVADHMVGSIGTLALQAGIREPYTVKDLARLMQDHARQSDRRLEELERNFTNYFTGLGDLRNAIELYIAAANSNDNAARNQARAAVHRSHAKVMTTGHRIRDMERSILARRMPLPDLLIERLEEDGQLLGMVRRLVNSDSPEGLNEAAGRFNAVIKAWQELLK